MMRSLETGVTPTFPINVPRNVRDTLIFCHKTWVRDRLCHYFVYKCVRNAIIIDINTWIKKTRKNAPLRGDDQPAYREM